MIETILTFYIFVIMSAIAKIHVYWIGGGVWPGKDKNDLINKVLGQGDIFPSLLSCIFVIIVFILMALFPLISYFKIDLGLINNYIDYVYLFFASIFLLRASLILIPNMENKAHKLFILYNKKYYSPVCFSLFISYFVLYLNYK
ncbi:MAG: DUF3995 domain-containing protein [Campylobacteraceae bacterium]|nr:DUF3995 domain-containing protein [Campylobacteraceae bacterium]